MSVVEAVRARREDVLRGSGVGRESKRGPMRGRRGSTSERSRGGERGERREDVRAVRSRVVCVRWVEREVCAVMSLGLRNSVSVLNLSTA